MSEDELLCCAAVISYAGINSQAHQYYIVHGSAFCWARAMRVLSVVFVFAFVLRMSARVAALWLESLECNKGSANEYLLHFTLYITLSGTHNSKDITRRALKAAYYLIIFYVFDTREA